MGLMIFGAIVLLGAIAVVVFSLRRNSQGEEDDPLQSVSLSLFSEAM